MKPLAIDLFCGLGGWTEGLLSEGYYVVGFDIERHDYGTGGYPAQLVLQDALTLHGKQFKDAALIVASPPCQEYSYMAMPWSKAKAKERDMLEGRDDPKRLTALFDACFRIQREAIEAATLAHGCAVCGIYHPGTTLNGCNFVLRHIPLVVENVRGAQKWVGRSRWNYGSFHLWGDVPALMPIAKAVKLGGGASWYPPTDPRHVPGIDFTRLAGQKTPEGNCSDDVWKNRPVARLAHATHAEMEAHGFKVPGFRFDGSGGSFQTASVEGIKDRKDGGKSYGGGFEWDGTAARRMSSHSPARKAASAAIAKIPLPLARHIARYWAPLAQTA